MALSIMFYHLSNWIIHPLDSSGPLGRLGVYGVSIFFILSGLSMAIVYNRYLTTIQSAGRFFIRRIFRIWPLFWIVCLLVVFHQRNLAHSFDPFSLVLNLTTLFGFISPTNYIPVGAWSIGNEMVYYALTPLIIAAYNHRKWAGNTIFVITLIIGLYFAFSLLDADLSIARQWNIYVNPFNNLFLYVAGIAIFYNLLDIRIKPTIINMMLILAVLLFCVMPSEGNHIVIVSGTGRVIFVILSTIIVICFYKMQPKLPKFIAISLENIGMATYGVYLIHPVIYVYFKQYLPNYPDVYNPYMLIVMVSITTVALSIIIYRTIELRFIKLGKSITS
ncbi:MAG TPA: acyltransferase [Bacteroidales bacterium]|nr:acyltransferase [Bacteroidales bacterium]